MVKKKGIQASARDSIGKDTVWLYTEPRGVLVPVSCCPSASPHNLLLKSVNDTPTTLTGRFYLQQNYQDWPAESDDDGCWSIQWSIQRQKFIQKCPCATSACRKASQRLCNGFSRGATAQRVQAGRPGHGSARRRASVVPARTLCVWCGGSGIAAAQLGGTTFGLFDADPEC